MLAACHIDLADIGGAFYDGHGRTHCAINLDTGAHQDTANLDAALDRARDRGEVLELYAHNPGATVPIETIAYVLASARDRGLAFVTYGDFARGDHASPGLALSFDDTSIAAWVAALPLFREHGARITFFISRYAALREDERAMVPLLATEGHEIAAHSVQHLRAPEYVEKYGLAAYLRDEVDPSIEALERDGFEVNAFAYPFGARTAELDDAIAMRVPVLRSVVFSLAVAQDPCPR